jgi:hypothetical protein
MIFAQAGWPSRRLPHPASSIASTLRRRCCCRSTFGSSAISASRRAIALSGSESARGKLRCCSSPGASRWGTKPRECQPRGSDDGCWGCRSAVGWGGFTDGSLAGQINSAECNSAIRVRHSWDPRFSLGAVALRIAKSSRNVLGAVALRMAKSSRVQLGDPRSTAPRAARLRDQRRYSDTIGLNPPQNIRLPSNGIAFGSIIDASRGSLITLALMRSRSLRDL